VSPSYLDENIRLLGTLSSRGVAVIPALWSFGVSRSLLSLRAKRSNLISTTEIATSLAHLAMTWGSVIASGAKQSHPLGTGVRGPSGSHRTSLVQHPGLALLDCPSPLE